MARYQLRTFKDIIDAVCEQLKIQATDTISRNRVRRNINTIYLDEVVPYKEWKWTRDHRTLQTTPKYTAGRATVTQNSTTVTMSEPVSFDATGHYFASDTGGDVYIVASHSPGSSIIELETPFTGSTLSNATYVLWSNVVVLPTNCKEVIEVTHRYQSQPLTALSLQEFRRSIGGILRLDGRPSMYTTTEVKDPDPYMAVVGMPTSISRSSSGIVKSITFDANIGALLSPGDVIRVRGAGNYTYNVEAVISAISGGTLSYTATVPTQESNELDSNIIISKQASLGYEGAKELLIHPACTAQRTTLHIDFLKEVMPLEHDSDEPLIPVEDRIILFYGAMWLSSDRERHSDRAGENFQLFQKKLDRMAGKSEDSPDKPKLRVSPFYLRGKKYQGRARDIGAASLGSFGGALGGSTVTGTANTVAVFNEQGELVGSSSIDLSALEFLLGAQGGLTSILASNQSTPQLIDSWDAVEYKHVQVIYGMSRGPVYETGTIFITTDGASAALSVAGSSSLGSTGVTFSADVFGGRIRLLYTSDDSGPSAPMSYRVLLL